MLDNAAIPVVTIMGYTLARCSRRCGYLSRCCFRGLASVVWRFMGYTIGIPEVGTAVGVHRPAGFFVVINFMVDLLYHISTAHSL